MLVAVESGKTRTAKATKAGHKASVTTYKKMVMKSPDPGRIMMLLYVKTFIIAHLFAFSLSNSKHVRVFFELISDSAFKQDKLYPPMIKHDVVELYTATMSQFTHNLRLAVTEAGGAIRHANFDLWTSKMSNEKYIGGIVYVRKIC